MRARVVQRVTGGLLLAVSVGSGLGCHHPPGTPLFYCHKCATCGAACPPGGYPPPRPETAPPPRSDAPPSALPPLPPIPPANGPKPVVYEIRQSPTVEVREAPPVHVQLPPQTVVLERPAPPTAASTPAVAAPSYQSAAAGRRRVLAIDTIRIPFPVVRFVTAPEPEPVAPAPVASAPPPQTAPPPYAQRPTAQPVTPAGHVPQPAAPPQVSQQALDEYCRQVDALKAALDASKAAVGGAR